METRDILPDSRPRETKGRIFTRNGVTWVPFYCANCFKHCGSCPETSTFLFYLCPKCFETHGEIAGTMIVPDQVFYERVAQEQQEAHGRPLTHAEMVQVVQEDCTPLATLLKESK